MLLLEESTRCELLEVSGIAAMAQSGSFGDCVKCESGSSKVRLETGVVRSPRQFGGPVAIVTYPFFFGLRT